MVSDAYGRYKYAVYRLCLSLLLHEDLEYHVAGDNEDSERDGQQSRIRPPEGLGMKAERRQD